MHIYDLAARPFVKRKTISMNSNEDCHKRYNMLRSLTDMYSTLPDKTIIDDFSTRRDAYGCDMTISLDIPGGIDALNTMGLYKRQFGPHHPYCYLDSMFKTGSQIVNMH